jgi:hypothetical protein
MSRSYLFNEAIAIALLKRATSKTDPSAWKQRPGRRNRASSHWPRCIRPGSRGSSSGCLFHRHLVTQEKGFPLPSGQIMQSASAEVDLGSTDRLARETWLSRILGTNR